MNLMSMASLVGAMMDGYGYTVRIAFEKPWLIITLSYDSNDWSFTAREKTVVFRLEQGKYYVYQKDGTVIQKPASNTYVISRLFYKLKRQAMKHLWHEIISP